MRQGLSVPILDTFHTWLEEQRPQVLPKSPLAEALGYALNNWAALCRYTEAGFLSIDNVIASYYTSCVGSRVPSNGITGRPWRAQSA
jgi:Transposase IS66 family